jgi:hypothetical protein
VPPRKIIAQQHITISGVVIVFVSVLIAAPPCGAIGWFHDKACNLDPAK